MEEKIMKQEKESQTDYWREYWSCSKCKFNLPFRKVKQSDIEVSGLNLDLKCRKCGNTMQRTNMKEQPHDR